MKGSRTNITDSRWASKSAELSPVQKSVVWREGVHLLAPSDSLKFESDRYYIDGRVGAILTIMVKEGSNYKLPKAWGVNAIPSVTDSKASVSLITNVGVVPEKEVIDKISEATKSARGSLDEAEELGQLTDASAAQQLADDMSDIAVEIKSGSYMSLSMRLNVVADDEDECDDDYDDDDGDAIVGNLIRLTPFCLNRVDVFVLVHQLSFYHRNFRCPNELMKWNNHFRM